MCVVAPASVRGSRLTAVFNLVPFFVEQVLAVFVGKDEFWGVQLRVTVVIPVVLFSCR